MDHLVVLPWENSVTTKQIILKPLTLGFLFFKPDKKLFEKESLMVTENQSALQGVPQK